MADKFLVHCPHCGAEFEVERKCLYRKAKCGACGRDFIIGAKNAHGAVSYGGKVSPSRGNFISSIWASETSPGFRFLTPLLATILARIEYVVIAIIAVFIAVGSLCAMSPAGVLLAIPYVFAGVLLVLGVRISYEIVIAFFRMAEDIHAIREHICSKTQSAT